MIPTLFNKWSVPIYLVIFISGLFGSQMECSAKALPEPPGSFGYHALKINNQFVDPKIFLEEKNRFFLRWRTNSEMMYKSEEERMDLLLEDIIDRVLLEDFLHNRSGIRITTQETENYVNHYIKPKFPSKNDFDSFLQEEGYKNESGLRNYIELYLIKIAYFVKMAKESGLSIPQKELDSLYRKHVNENSFAVTSQIIISDLDSIKARELAAELYRQCKSGTDFDTLAAHYTSGSSVRSSGAVHSMISRAGFDSVITDKIFSAQHGEVLPPMKHELDYILVRVERFISTSHTENEFADMLLLKKFGDSELYKKWITELKSKASIVINDPALKAYRLYRKSNYYQAGVLYEKLYLNGNNEFYLKRAIDCFDKAGKSDKLFHLAQTGIKNYPDNLLYPLTKAEYLYHKGKTSDALVLLKEIETRALNSPYFTDLLEKTRAKLGIGK